MRRRHIKPDQLELFVPPQWPCPLQTPQWQNLPRRTRSEVTSLMARLLMEHGRRERNESGGAVADPLPGKGNGDV